MMRYNTKKLQRSVEMNKNFKSCIALALVLICVFALAACGKKLDTPWGWAQNIGEEDIESAKLTCSAEYYEKLAAESGEATDGEEAPVFKDVSFELSDKQIEKLRTNLYRLEEENFSEAEGDLNKAPLYGLTIVMNDETTFEIIQAASDPEAFEMLYGEKLWIISNEKFSGFVQSLIEGGVGASADTDKVASSSDLVPEEVTVTGSDLEVTGDSSYSTYGNLG